MTVAVTNGTVDEDAKRIRERENRREALRARLFGARTEPEATAELIASLETEVKNLDAEIRGLKGGAADNIDSTVEPQT